MAKEYFTSEQIVNKVRDAEVLISQGKTVAKASRARSANRAIIAGAGNMGAWAQNKHIG